MNLLKFGQMAAVGMSLLIVSAGVALAADGTAVDPDGATPFAADSSNPTHNIGNVCLDTEGTGQVLIKAENGGGSQVWADSATLTLKNPQKDAGDDAADLTAGVGSPSSFTLPNNWNSLDSGTLSAGHAVGTFSVTSSETGLHSAHVKWDLEGAKSGSGTHTAPSTPVKVDWNVVDCNPAPADGDNDGEPDDTDNCPTVANADQADADGDGIGDACEADSDGDGVIDDNDNCVAVANGNQADADSDGIGNACEADTDGDGVIDDNDNCVNHANTNQANADGDLLGDACDSNSFAPAIGIDAVGDSGDEGDTLSVSGSFTDGDGNGTMSLTADNGTVGTFTPNNATGEWMWTLSTTDDVALATITVTASDGEHANATDSFTYSAANVAPSATFNAPTTSVNEGSNINISLTGLIDPGTADTHQYNFSCDGGTTWTGYGSSSSHSCATTDNGTVTVKGQVKDDDGGESPVYSANVSVLNVPPTISATSGFGSSALSCGPSNATLTVNFTDPGSADTHKLDIDWDNDGTFEQTVNPYTSGSGVSHTYSGAGSHTAAFKVTDDDGGVSASSTATAWVNYNLSSILQPINDTRNGQPTSLFKYGSTIPVKVEVTDCDGSHPSNLVLKVTWKQGLNQTPTGIEEVIPTSQADLGNVMRFSDPLYVLQLNSKNTTADSTSGITIEVKLYNGSTVVQSTWANIGFKK